MGTVGEEQGIPEPIARAVVRFVECAGPFFPTDSLRMGGGTILQARWGHRRSTDADLFCDPGIYVETIRQHGAAMESELGRIADDAVDGEPFVDLVATYCRVGGTEVTILPAAPLIDDNPGRCVPGTTVRTESTADILAGKLVHRMGGAGVVEPRDVFDIVAAERHDPAALRRAVGLLTDAQLKAICATLLMLPARWDAGPEKPVLSISGERGGLAPAEVVVGLLRRFAQATPGSEPAPASGSKAPEP